MSAGPRQRPPRRARGQHFLRSARLAGEIVAAAEVRVSELVVEVGPGWGRLTGPLCDAGARVVAIELDPALAAPLRRRFHRHGLVVVTGDALTVPLPQERYRAIGNVPFHISSQILRRLLDDPASPLERADLIVQDGLARKRAALRPCTMLSLSWLPWWQLRIDRHLPAACFEPPPPVDAAILSARRRAPALLDPAQAAGYRRFLEAMFVAGGRPLRHSLPLSPLAWKRFARERGLPHDAHPPQLDVWDWTALHSMVAQ